MDSDSVCSEAGLRILANPATFLSNEQRSAILQKRKSQRDKNTRMTKLKDKQRRIEMKKERTKRREDTASSVYDHNMDTDLATQMKQRCQIAASSIAPSVLESLPPIEDNYSIAPSQSTLAPSIRPPSIRPPSTYASSIAPSVFESLPPIEDNYSIEPSQSTLPPSIRPPSIPAPSVRAPSIASSYITTPFQPISHFTSQDLQHQTQHQPQHQSQQPQQPSPPREPQTQFQPPIQQPTQEQQREPQTQFQSPIQQPTQEQQREPQTQFQSPIQQPTQEQQREPQERQPPQDPQALQEYIQNLIELGLIRAQKKKLDEEASISSNDDLKKEFDEIQDADIDEKLRKDKKNGYKFSDNFDISSAKRYKKEMEHHRAQLSMEEVQLEANCNTFITMGADMVETLFQAIDFHALETKDLSKKVDIAIDSGRFSTYISQYANIHKDTIAASPVASLISTFASIVLRNHLSHKTSTVMSGNEENNKRKSSRGNKQEEEEVVTEKPKDIQQKAPSFVQDKTKNPKKKKKHRRHQKFTRFEQQPSSYQYYPPYQPPHSPYPPHPSYYQQYPQDPNNPIHHPIQPNPTHNPIHQQPIHHPIQPNPTQHPIHNPIHQQPIPNPIHQQPIHQQQIQPTQQPIQPTTPIQPNPTIPIEPKPNPIKPKPIEPKPNPSKPIEPKPYPDRVIDPITGEFRPQMSEVMGDIPMSQLTSKIDLGQMKTHMRKNLDVAIDIDARKKQLEKNKPMHESIFD